MARKHGSGHHSHNPEMKARLKQSYGMMVQGSGRYPKNKRN